VTRRPRQLRHRLGGLSAVLALATAATLAGAGVASAGSGVSGNPSFGSSAGGSSGSCSANTGRVLAGTLTGQDGLALNATIGFDMLDSHGRKINLDTGCVTTGYSTVVQLNHYISGRGAPVGTPMTSAASKYIPAKDEGVTTTHFRITGIPAAVTNVWIETYPRSFNGSPCGLTCAGPLDNTKYGQSNVRALPLHSGTTTVSLTAPTTKAFGGSTGSIKMRLVHNGHLVGADHVYAYSTGKNLVRLQGWGIGRAQGDGSYLVPALASNQPYVVWSYFGNRIVKHSGVYVHPKTMTTVTVQV